MAERRISSVAAIRLPTLPPHAGWFVQDAAGAVVQPFYAALDSDRRLCWTDSPGLAEQFRSKTEAERFVLDRLTTEARVVSQV